MVLAAQNSPLEREATPSSSHDRDKKSTLIDQHDGLRTFVVVLATGDEAVKVPRALHRRFDRESGLALIDVQETGRSRATSGIDQNRV